jgi:iron complex outermembrane receptor protein
MGSLVWRTGVEKVTNENAWRESPSEFGHSYLFPMEPRTFALSPQAVGGHWRDAIM